MTTIDEKYIKSFLPIQELDGVRINPATGVADVISDDLFLMSLISVYATNDSNAIAVSKKIRYLDFKELLSSELSIADLNIDIDDLSDLLHELSVKEKNDVTSLSNAIKLSASTLSTYINSSINNLSNTVSSNYVTKYSLLCTLITRVDDLMNPATLASKIHLNNGRLTVTETIDASCLLAPNGWRLSQSGIRIDVNKETTLQPARDLAENLLVYPVLSDCYLNCMISAYENDSTASLLVKLRSYTDSGILTTRVIDQFNNPGGYPGYSYYNFYHCSFPVKSWNDTSVIFSYSDNSMFRDHTKIHISEHPFYAVIAKDELASYVKKQDASTLDTLASHKNDANYLLYLMKINADGLVKDVSSVYYGIATSTKPGLIQANATGFNDPRYPVNVTEFNNAYVEIPHATTSKYGTIKLNSGSPTSNPTSLDCGLTASSTGQGYVNIPYATNNKYGLVKTNATKYSDTTLNAELSSYLRLNSSGLAYVVIPQASFLHNGVIKTGIKEDVGGITMARSVYVDSDGIAKVNVAANYDVGQYYDDVTNKGFDTIISVQLNATNRLNTSSVTASVVDFTGASNACSLYGNYIWASTSYTAGAFLARVAYEGSSNTVLSNATILVICDSNAVTTMNIGQSLIGSGKRFICSQDLGMFSGNGHQENHLFAAISNANAFNNGKLYFLIKHLNYD